MSRQTPLAARSSDDAASPALGQLLRDGYYIVEGALGAGQVASLAGDLVEDFEQTPQAEGPFYGSWTKRFHGLLRRSDRMDGFVRHPLVLDLVERILGPACDTIQLNLTQAIEILPGRLVQPPHRDQDMWPVRTPGVEYLVNVMWPFTPYTAENGATLIWPGSNRHQEALLLDPEDAVAAVMAPGSFLMFLGSTLHAGGANATMLPRRGMIVSYSLGWLKPYRRRRCAGSSRIFRCPMACRVSMIAGSSAGSFFVIRNGLRWRDAPAEYGPPKTIYNRFIRWSRLVVFNKIFAGLAAKGGKPDQLMIDATHLKAHRTAASLLKKGLFPDVSDAPKAA